MAGSSEIEERLHFALESARMVVWDWDLASDRVTRIGDVKRVLGDTGGARIDSEHFFQSIHPEDRSRVRRALAAALDEGTDYGLDFRIVGADGGVRWINDQGRVKRDAEGRPVHMSGIARDITDHRRAEQEVERLNRDLKHRVDELETLLEVVPVGIAVAQDPECRNITVNPAAAAMLGIPHRSNASKSAPDAEQLPFKVLDNGVEVPPEELPMQRAAAEGISIRDLELDVMWADGTVLNLFEYASPLYDEEGKLRGSLGVFVDITERKQAEAQLQRQATQLAEADRRKDEFLAMLAHELRNPLASIRSAVEVLQRRGDEVAPEHLAWSLGIVERQIEQLTRLVDDLLDVARITRGHIELREATVTLEQLVTRAVETVFPAVEERQHDLTVSLPSTPVHLTGDPIRLSQAVANLLHNAAKYTPAGGRIEVEAGATGSEAVVRVRDTGQGIAPELLPRVFDLFTQDDSALDRSRGGLGLGLPLARRLIEMHGGSLEAASEGRGRGSLFTVRLPLGRTIASHPPAEVSPTSPPSRAILVIDDNADSADALAELLRLDGHEVRVAYDGPTALALARSHPPEVVLLDIGLPTMDGYEVARRLRREHGNRRFRLVALTGYGQSEDRRRAREAGFDQHLLKPVDLAKLRGSLG